MAEPDHVMLRQNGDTAIREGVVGDHAPVTLGWLELGCQYLCEAGLWVLVGLVIVGIIARDAFGLPFSMSDEVGGYILVGLTFMSMPVCFSSGAFHRVTFLQMRLRPLHREMLNLFFDVISLICSLLLAWQLTSQVIQSWQNGDVAPTPLATPLWIPQLFMPLGCALLAIVQLRACWKRLQTYFLSK